MLTLIAATLVAAAAADGGQPILETTSLVIGAAGDAGAPNDLAPPVESTPALESPAVPAPIPADAPVLDAGVEPPIEATQVADAGANPPPSTFIKGELSVYLGSGGVTVKNNRIGVSAGLDSFGQAYYLLVEPQVDLRLFGWGVGVGVPLRFELLSFETAADGSTPLTKNMGRIRKEDWDSFHDYGRLLKYVNYGLKEDNFYVNIGQRYATTIGHGSLMRRYAPNIDIDYPRVSAEVDAYNDFGGFELFANDILEWNLLSGIAFIKPLWFLKSSNLLVKSLSLGISGGLDWKAPLTLDLDSVGARVVSLEDRRLKTTPQAVKLIGFDAEVKVYKDDNIDVKPYVDYSLLAGGDGGLTLGALARINLGKQTVNAFRLVGELRFLGSRYQPGYFDTFYEVERNIYNFNETRIVEGAIQYKTKQDVVLNGGLGARTGYFFEFSWGIRGAIGFTASLEGVSNSAEKNFVAHLEVPLLDFVQIFGSFYKHRFSDFSEFTKLDQQSVFFAGARIKVLPFFFLNGRAYKTFRVNPDNQRYDNQIGFLVDAEIGYEFGGKKADDAPSGNTPATETTPPPAPAETAPAPAPDAPTS